MAGNLVVQDTISSGTGITDSIRAIYPAGSTIQQTLILQPQGTTGSQFASSVGFSMLTLNPLVGGPITLTAQKGTDGTYLNQTVNSLLQIDDTVDTFQLSNQSTAAVTVSMTFIVAYGTTTPVTGVVTDVNGFAGPITIQGGTGIGVSAASGIVTVVNTGVMTVNGQAPGAGGNVVIIAEDNSDGSGTTLIADSGATDGTIKLKTIVAGSGITLSSDSNGNLEITSEGGGTTLEPATPTTLGGVIVPVGSGLTVDGSGNLMITGAVTSVSGQTGAVVVRASNANSASGASLIVADGSTTGNILLKTIVAGTGITVGADANGNVEISGVSQYTLPAATISTLGGVIVGSGLAISAGVLSTTATYTLPAATVTNLGGVSIGNGLTVTVGGALSANVQSVNGLTGAVVISASSITTGNFPSAVLGGSAVANSILTTNASNVPTWSQSIAPNQIGTSAGDNQVLITNASGVSTWVSTVPTANLPAALVGAVDFQTSFIPGTTVLPAAAAGNKGWYYVASAAGTYTPPGGTLLTFAAGDWLISDGTAWTVLNTQGAITSVNGQTGAVVITASSLGLAAVATSGNYSDLTGAPGPYTLPAATTSALGGVIVGAGLTVSSGTVSANVQSVAGRSGAIVLAVADVAGAAPLLSPALTGVPTAPTATAGTNTTQVATTAFVQAAVSSTGVISFNTRTGAITFQAADITSVGGALLASPTFTGVPAAPTASPGTSTTQVATTAFVAAAVSGINAVTSFNSRTGAVSLSGSDITGAGGAVLASPAFSGVPTAPTATVGTSTGQIATTSFVATSFAPLASPAFTGRLQTDALSATVVALGSVSGTQTLNLAASTFWTATITGSTTFAFTNTLAAARTEAVYLRLVNAGAFTITWPTGTQFAGGTAPVFTSSGTDLVGVLYDIPSASYMVFVLGLNMKV